MNNDKKLVMIYDFAFEPVCDGTKQTSMLGRSSLHLSTIGMF